MIPTDKELNEALLAMLEDLFVENILLKGQVRRARRAGYSDNADRRGLKAAAELARTSFRRQYTQATQSTDHLSELRQKLCRPSKTQ